MKFATILGHINVESTLLFIFGLILIEKSMRLEATSAVETIGDSSQIEKRQLEESDAASEMYYVDDGCHSGEQGKNDDFVASFEPKSFEAGARCCAKDSNGVSCLSHTITKLSCKTDKMSYDEAVSHCEGFGSRLCTKDELLSEVCCGKGGDCDNHLVWTSTSKSVANFTYIENTYSPNAQQFEVYTTLVEAQTACLENSICTMVTDNFFPTSGSILYRMCSGTTTTSSSLLASWTGGLTPLGVWIKPE